MLRYIMQLKEKSWMREKSENHIRFYDVIYGVFSKSGFTQRMLDAARETSNLVLVNEDNVIDVH